MTATEEQVQNMVRQISEISDRTRRTETGLHKIREAMGIDISSGNQLRVIGPNTVTAQGHDVTLSGIKRCLNAEGKFAHEEPVCVWVGGELIAEIQFA